MSNNYTHTPLYKSVYFKKQFNLNIHYKMDCLQPSGSFKIRGMDRFLKVLSGKGATKVIASSGGNAGYSLAYVGKQLSIAVKLIVPKTTAAFMIDKIKLLGAEVTVQGDNWNEANECALQLSSELNLPYISPFDHPLLWEGHSTIIDECAAEMNEPDKIIVAVGGGGLLCGIFEGLTRNKWNKAKVITAETEGAASFAESFRAGELITLKEINTIATSLGAKTITKKALEYAAHFNVETYVTNDKSTINACNDFFDEFDLIVEPACGAALSYIKNNLLKISEEENILVIVCGGTGMSKEKLMEYTQKYK